MRSTTTGRLGRGLAVAGLAAALGFGGAAAFASPAAAAERDRCTDFTCRSRCINLGYAGGSCSGASCVCWQT